MVAFIIITKIIMSPASFEALMYVCLCFSDHQPREKVLLPQTNTLFCFCRLYRWYNPTCTHNVFPPPFSLSITHAQTQSNIINITSRRTWPVSAVALPLAWVCLNLLFEVEDCPQFKQVCPYADVQLKHVVCISCCTGAKVSFHWSRSLAQHVIWG